MSDSDKTIIQNHQGGKGHRFEMKERAILVEVTSKEFGTIYPLDKPLNLIGRGKECHIRLDEEEISKVHCSIHIDLDGYITIEDEESTNGTLVNGKKLRKRRSLNFSDRLVIGNHVFRFLREESL